MRIVGALGVALAGLSVIGGVSTTPFRTSMKLAAEPSEMWPSAFRTIASSNPDRIASVFARAEFTYDPTIFPRAGIALSSTRRHDEIVA